MNYGGATIPVAPAPIGTWDWTSDNSFSTYATPWGGNTANGALGVYERDLPSEGWILYDRRLFAGDHGLSSSNIIDEAGALYFSLYNKFTGALRIFHVHSSISGITGKYATIKITNSGSPYSSYGFINQSMQGNLFNSSGPNGYTSTQANPAIPSTQTAYSPGQTAGSADGNTAQPWWVFDFQLDYDPIGVSERRFFYLDIRSRTTTELQLSGTLKGTISDVVNTPNFGPVLDVGLNAIKDFGPKFLGKGITELTKYLPGGDSLLSYLNKNNMDIAEPIAKGLVNAGISSATHAVGTTQSTTLASIFSADLEISGTLKTDAYLGPQLMGVFEPILPANDPAAPAISKNQTNNAGLISLGLVSYTRAPKVWVYSGGNTLTSERGVFGNGSGNLIPALGNHEFKIEDPWCSGLIRVNPASGNRIMDVTTAISETNWSYATNGYLGLIFWDLEKKTSDFSTKNWITNWPSQPQTIVYQGASGSKQGGTIIISTSKATPILPVVSNLQFPSFANAKSLFSQYNLYMINPTGKVPLLDANGQSYNKSYTFISSGDKTPVGESYDRMAPLAVPILTKLVGPLGRQQILSTIRVTDLQYVADRATFDAINPGYSCPDRRNGSSPIYSSPALKALLSD